MRTDVVPCRTSPEKPSVAQISLGTKGGLDVLTSNTKGPIILLATVLEPYIHCTAPRSIFFFFAVVSFRVLGTGHNTAWKPEGL